MYLYVVSPALSDADTEEGERAAYTALIQNLADCGEQASLGRVDVGRGASADAFKIFLEWLPALSPIALFFLGSQIEKNLDSWVSLARRLRALIGKLRNLGYNPIVTFEAACAVAFDEIVANDWHGPGFAIDHIVLSNRYVQIHSAFPTMDALKEYIEADRRDNADPLAGEVIYTFFGRCEATLFIVSVEDGIVLFSKQLN